MLAGYFSHNYSTHKFVLRNISYAGLRMQYSWCSPSMLFYSEWCMHKQASLWIRIQVGGGWSLSCVLTILWVCCLDLLIEACTFVIKVGSTHSSVGKHMLLGMTTLRIETHRPKNRSPFHCSDESCCTGLLTGSWRWRLISYTPPLPRKCQVREFAGPWTFITLRIFVEPRTAKNRISTCIQ